MPRNSSKPASDVTGRQAEKLAEEFAAQQQEAQERMGTVAAQRAAEDGEVVEWDGPQKAPEPTVNPNFQFDDDGGPVVETTEVELTKQKKKFRVNTDLEDVTIGAGNNYSFARDKVYHYPVDIYNHLNEKGLIWH